jgi:hypothetical protein
VFERNGAIFEKVSPRPIYVRIPPPADAALWKSEGPLGWEMGSIDSIGWSPWATFELIE